MSATGSGASLGHATKNILVEWERTAPLWNDARGREFHAKYMEELPANVSRALAAIQEIEALLRKVRNDCE